MSTKTLRDFIEEKAQVVNDAGRIEKVREWQRAVAALLDQFRAWLKEADPHGVLKIEEEREEANEEGMGIFTVPALRILLDGAAVRVIPRSRRNAGWIDLGPVRHRREGGVDITSGSRRYFLYRAIVDGGDQWFAKADEFGAPIQRLDRARFEAIVQELLT